MPILKIYGIPIEMSGGLDELVIMLKKRISSIKELGLNEDQISCFFPSDLLEEGLGEEIIAFVDGLFKKPERTKEVQDNLAEMVVATLYEFSKKAINFGSTVHVQLIECIVKPFDEQKHGIASLTLRDS